MTSAPTPLPSRDRSGRDAPLSDAALDAALGVFRDDCRAQRVAPRLAERVLAAAARGDVEAARFSRVARTYAAAAAVLAAAGVLGSVLVRHDGVPASAYGASRTSLFAIEEAGILREGARSALELRLDGARR